MIDPPDHPWVPLAAEALRHASNNDIELATEAVQRMVEQHGRPSLSHAMLAWCDTVIATIELPDGVDPADVGLAFRHSGQSSVTFAADDVPAHVAWAGRFFNARLRMDQPTSEALYWAVPQEQFSLHVGQLLICCGLMLAAARGGAALVGTQAQITGRRP